jgi:amino acid transporter
LSLWPALGEPAWPHAFLPWLTRFCSLFGFFLNVAMVFAGGDTASGTIDMWPGGLAFAEIVRLRAGRVAFLIIWPFICSVAFFVVQTALMANARSFYAFSRDGGLPDKKFFAKINKKTTTTVNAVWLVVACCAALGLLSFASYTAVAAIFSLAALGMDLSFEYSSLFFPCRCILIIQSTDLPPIVSAMIFRNHPDGEFDARAVASLALLPLRHLLMLLSQSTSRQAPSSWAMGGGPPQFAASPSSGRSSSGTWASRSKIVVFSLTPLLFSVVLSMPQILPFDASIFNYSWCFGLVFYPNVGQALTFPVTGWCLSAFSSSRWRSTRSRATRDRALATSSRPAAARRRPRLRCTTRRS